MLRRTLLLSLAALAAACEPKVIEFKVNIVTSACDSTPLNQVTHLRLRVSGEGLSPPIEVVSSVSVEGKQVEIPLIPAGKKRVVEVRGYSGEPGGGGQVKSIGRSLPFDVPDVVPQAQAAPVTVFLRPVDTFSQPSRASSPNTCTRMISARAGHTATLLPNGLVYVAGGYQQNGGPARTALDKAEFFNPETGDFEDAPEIGLLNSTGMFTPLPRAFHTATLLANGQVLLWDGEEYAKTGDVDGSSPDLRASVLVFDYDRREYGGVPFQNLSNIARSHHAAARDVSGKVVIVGGLTRDAQRKIVVADKVEWYDLVTSTAKVVDGVSLPRRDMSMLAVQDGAFIAVAGGSDGTTLKDDVSFFRFDPSLNAVVQQTVTTPPRLRESRRAAAQAVLNGSNDLVLIGGYSDVAAVKPILTTEIVSTKNSFNVSDGPAVTVPRGELCAALLGDGRVLAIGGRTVETAGGPPRSDGTVDLIVPQASGTPSVLGKEALKVGRYNHTCTTLADGSVLVLGGVREANGTFEVLKDALIYTPAPLDP